MISLPLSLVLLCGWSVCTFVRSKVLLMVASLLLPALWNKRHLGHWQVYPSYGYTVQRAWSSYKAFVQSCSVPGPSSICYCRHLSASFLLLPFRFVSPPASGCGAGVGASSFASRLRDVPADPLFRMSDFIPYNGALFNCGVLWRCVWTVIPSLCEMCGSSGVSILLWASNEPWWHESSRGASVCLCI